MQVNDSSYQIKDLIESSKNPLVILGSDADVDLASLAVAFVEIFESYSKKTLLINKSNLPPALEAYVKKELLRDKVEAKSLVISLDWAKNKLEKVSYDLDGDTFNLIITSRGKKIDNQELSYSYRGQSCDLLVILGVKKEADLYSLGIDIDTFLDLPSVLISKDIASYAKVNITDQKVDSLSALCAKIFEGAKVSLPTRAAEALLYGMRIATNNFNNVSDPQTFEAAAYCKRSMIPGMVKREETRVGEPQKTEKVVSPSIDEKEKTENWLSPKVFRSGRIS